MGIGQFLSLAGVLLCVAVILFLAYWCTRRLGLAAGTGLSGAGNHMRVVDRLVLSQDKQIVLAQIGERWLVLGLSTGGGIQLLVEISSEEAEIWKKEADTSRQVSGFGEILRQALHNRKPGK